MSSLPRVRHPSSESGAVSPFHREAEQPAAVFGLRGRHFFEDNPMAARRSGLMPNGKRRPNDVIVSFRGRVRRAPKAVQEGATSLLQALQDAHGIDQAIRALIVARIPKDMPDELVARLAMVSKRTGENLRDDLYDLFSIYLDAAIAAERKRWPVDHRCIHCAELRRGAMKISNVGWLCTDHFRALQDGTLPTRREVAEVVQ